MTAAVRTCVCDIKVLMDVGCGCGGFQAEMQAASKEDSLREIYGTPVASEGSETGDGSSIWVKLRDPTTLQVGEVYLHWYSGSRNWGLRKLREQNSHNTDTFHKTEKRWQTFGYLSLNPRYAHLIPKMQYRHLSPEEMLERLPPPPTTA